MEKITVYYLLAIPIITHINRTVTAATTPIQKNSVQTHSQKPVRYRALSCSNLLRISSRCSS